MLCFEVFDGRDKLNTRHGRTVLEKTSKKGGIRKRKSLSEMVELRASIQVSRDMVRKPKCPSEYGMAFLIQFQLFKRHMKINIWG